jgi:hypothetical protein
LLVAILLVPRVAAAGSWQALTHQPTFAASTMYLLTDGTVICQVSGDLRWWKLTPDINGSYINGTWARIANSNFDRLYYAGGVFADGRVIVAGGEYSSSGSETKKTEIYDPVTNVWTEISAPSGWTNIGDAPSAILADGRFLLGSIFDSRTAIYDPVAGTWTAKHNKRNSQSTEESWVLLPDGTVVLPECVNHPNSEKYVPSQNIWVNTNALPVDLVDGILEIGAGVLMPDGRAFFMGATPHSALYIMPPNPSDAGTWIVGPDPPKVNNKNVGADDAPACLMPNGRVLLALSPVNGSSFMSPTYFFEFDGTSIIRIADPPNSGGFAYQGRMMILPTGQVLFAADTAAIYAYTGDGGPDPTWKPSITDVETNLARSHDYPLEGKQLNGLSWAVGYGDDAGNNTNYPLVRLKNNATGHVFYCRTHDHSTMAVATGDAIVSTNFRVPATAELGASTLTVVTNGIPSDSVDVIVIDATDVVPESFVMPQGQRVSGGIPELAASDDQYLILQPRLSSGNLTGLVQVAFTGTSPTATPTSLQFTLEAGVFATGLLQTIELLNQQTSQYELVDTRPASMTDTRITLTPGGNISRFVHPTTRAMTARVTFAENAALRAGLWQARVDQVVWTIQQ